MNSLSACHEAKSVKGGPGDRHVQGVEFDRTRPHECRGPSQNRADALLRWLVTRNRSFAIRSSQRQKKVSSRRDFAPIERCFKSGSVRLRLR